MKKRFFAPAVGGISLLTVFAVLCLSVFAMLTLTAAQADKRLSDTAARSVSDYYTADAQAEEIFAQLRSGQFPPQVRQTEDLFTYTVPINQNQSLEVALRYREGTWEVMQWQSVHPEEITDQTALPVWGGNN